MNFDKSTGIIEMFMDSLEVTDEGTFTFNLVDGKAKGTTSLVLIGDGNFILFYLFYYFILFTAIHLLQFKWMSIEGQQRTTFFTPSRHTFDTLPDARFNN